MFRAVMHSLLATGTGSGVHEAVIRLIHLRVEIVFVVQVHIRVHLARRYRPVGPPHGCTASRLVVPLANL